MTGSTRSGQKRTVAETVVAKPMELNDAVVEEYESSSLKDLVKAPITALQGVGPVISDSFKGLGVTTVEELANYKFYKIARSVVALAGTGTGQRHADCKMNINEAVMKDSEELSFEALAASQVYVLQGLTGVKSQLLEKVNVKTVEELANLKYIHWAEAICTLAEFEEDESKKAKAA